MMTDQNAPQSFGIKITGPCDTPGCPHPASVHYGLEEFYCLLCDDKNRATHLRWEREYKDRQEKTKWLRAIFEMTWPRFCRSCGASGLVSYFQSHDEGPSEPMQDVCEKCDGRCPRCGSEEVSKGGLTAEGFYEDFDPCPACGWKWGENDGDICPEFDLP